MDVTDHTPMLPEELLRLMSLDLSPHMEKVLADRDALSTELGPVRTTLS